MQKFFYAILLLNIIVGAIIFKQLVDYPTLSEKNAEKVAADLGWLQGLEHLTNQVVSTAKRIVNNANALLQKNNHADDQRGVIHPLQKSASNHQEYTSPTHKKECINIHNFKDNNSANEALNLLLGMGIEAKIYIDQVNYFWLYIPKQVANNRSQNIIKQMRALNFDAYYLADGPYQGGVSAGVFASEANALNYAKRLRQSGFPVTIEEHPKKNYRLLVNAPFVDAFQQFAHKKLQQRFANLTIQPNPC